MLKRQILAEGLKQYDINPEWIKDEHLDQMEVEQFQSHVDLSIELQKLKLPCDQPTFEEFVEDFMQNVQQPVEIQAEDVDEVGNMMPGDPMNNQNLN